MTPESPIDAMLNLSKFHREHEKFYAKSPLQEAVRLQEASVILKTLADRWSHVQPATSSKGDPYRGCENLNGKGDIAHSGVHFLESEGEPNELAQLRHELKRRGDDFAEGGAWLVQGMEHSWEEGKGLVPNPALADVLGERHRIITNDQHAAHLIVLSAREIRRALEILDHPDLSSAGVRKDLAGPRSNPGHLYSASEFLDLAADGLAGSAALVHDNERR